MSPANKQADSEEMKAEYDIRGGVRGKYFERYSQGTNLVLLEPDIAAVFHDSKSVNRALRGLIDFRMPKGSSPCWEIRTCQSGGGSFARKSRSDNSGPAR